MPESLETKFPSLKLVYPIAVASYDVALRRLEAVDTRLQTLLAFIVTLSAAFVSVASSQKIGFTSRWFAAAAAIFVIMIVVGSRARLRGTVRVLASDELFLLWPGKPEADFQSDIIVNAQKAAKYNFALVDYKWNRTVWLTVLLFAQVVCLAAWVLGGHP